LWTSPKRRIDLKLIVLLMAVLFQLAAFSADDAALSPQAGETALSTEEAAKILLTLPAFKTRHAIKARIMTEVDDLLGARVEEGTLLLDPPTSCLRKFTKPTLKVWLLNGNQIQEYTPASKKVYVKDFANAPEILRMLQAAVSGDLKTLGETFQIAVFRGTGEKGIAYRFVLTRDPENKKSSGGYKLIQARILESAPFYHEIQYVPESGDKVVERYLDIEVVAKPAEAEFNLDLPPDVARKVDVVTGGK